MGFFEFPHTRTYDSDLGWLIRRVIELSDQLKDFINLNTIKYADPILWNITTQYEGNTVVIDESSGTAYISTQPVPSGVPITNTDYWTPIYDYGGNMDELRAQIAAANEHRNATASRAYLKDELLFWYDKLYVVLYDIAAGTALIPDTNIEHVTVEDLINILNTNIENAVSRIIYATMQDVIADPEIKAGAHILTLGYNTINDEGGGKYNIRDNNTTSSFCIPLDNGLYAELVIEPSINVKQFGVSGNGTDNDTALLQTAITIASRFCVELVIPEGRYLVTSELMITDTVRIRGAGFHQNILVNSGTIILPDFTGSDKAVFNVHAPNCYFADLEIRYPGQTAAVEGQAFAPNDQLPWSFKLWRRDVAEPSTVGGHNATLSNLMLRNPTRGILIDGGYREHINQIYGCPYKVGIEIHHSMDVNYISDVHWWAFAPTSTESVAYTWANLVGIAVYRADGLFITNYFNIYSHVGILFSRDTEAQANGGGLCRNCQVSNIYNDLGEYMVQFANCTGVTYGTEVKFSNIYYQGYLASRSAAILVGSTCTVGIECKIVNGTFLRIGRSLLLDQGSGNSRFEFANCEAGEFGMAVTSCGLIESAANSEYVISGLEYSTNDPVHFIPYQGPGSFKDGAGNMLIVTEYADLVASGSGIVTFSHTATSRGNLKSRLVNAVCYDVDTEPYTLLSLDSMGLEWIRWRGCTANGNAKVMVTYRA